MRLKYDNIHFVKEVRDKESDVLFAVYVSMKSQAVADLRCYDVISLLELPKCVRLFINNHLKEFFYETEYKITYIYK